jgi:hypothetical protein
MFSPASCMVIDSWSPRFFCHIQVTHLSILYLLLGAGKQEGGVIILLVHRVFGGGRNYKKNTQHNVCGKNFHLNNYSSGTDCDNEILVLQET